MRDMDHAEHVLTLSEPFDDEPENTIGYHIDRIYGSVELLFCHLAVKDDQQDDIEHHLCLTRRPPDLGAGNDRSDTTAVDQTIEPRAEQGEYQRKAENIKYHFDVTLEELRAEEIEHRHQEHTAVEAEVPRLTGTDQALKQRKQLNADNADRRMQDRDDQRRIPFDPKILFEVGQPYKRNDRSDSEDDI